MNTIRNLNDLSQYGIRVLTGESCALNRRLLCDVTKEGKELVMKALGVPDISLSADWNGDGAVGSLLLDRETLQTISILALFNEKDVVEVWGENGSFSSLDKETLERYMEVKDVDFSDIRRYRLFGSDRNLHQMSGRLS